jgi:hypothetical protein
MVYEGKVWRGQKGSFEQVWLNTVEAWGRKVVAINLTINTENKSAKSVRQAGHWTKCLKMSISLLGSQISSTIWDSWANSRRREPLWTWWFSQKCIILAQKCFQKSQARKSCEARKLKNVLDDSMLSEGLPLTLLGNSCQHTSAYVSIRQHTLN